MYRNQINQGDPSVQHLHDSHIMDETEESQLDFHARAHHDMKVLNQQYVDKNSLMQQRYEEIILEMNTFKESLGKKIQVFEESKEDLLREVADLENIRKDKRTWISELEAREKNLEAK